MVQNHLLQFIQSLLSLFLGLENHCLSNSNSAFPAMENKYIAVSHLKVNTKAIRSKKIRQRKQNCASENSPTKEC